MDLDSAKHCKGPCLYWCSEKKHNVVRVCMILMVFVAGACVGALVATVCQKKRQANDANS